MPEDPERPLTPPSTDRTSDVRQVAGERKVDPAERVRDEEVREDAVRGEEVGNDDLTVIRHRGDPDVQSLSAAGDDPNRSSELGRPVEHSDAPAKTRPPESDPLPADSPADHPDHWSQLQLGRRRTPASIAAVLLGKNLNQFRLDSLIGGGGMGAVFRATDLRLDRTVAVKVIPFVGDDPELKRRFRNEAKSVAKLDHPRIAKVFEVGRDEPWHYIVFEFIQGQNLRDLVARDGVLSVDDAVFFTMQLADALGHASSRGITHRDVKPSNVVLADGHIKLVDMGLARSDHMEMSGDLTASGVTLGTFDYISPEQATDARAADLRSDLYSLGCTLYFMLTGGPPFPGGSMLQKLMAHGNQPPPDVREIRGDVSPALWSVLLKLLAKRPEDRYQNSDALVSDLATIAENEGLRRSRSAGTDTPRDRREINQTIARYAPWAAAIAATLLIAAALQFGGGTNDRFAQIPAEAQRLSIRAVPTTNSDRRAEVSSRGAMKIDDASSIDNRRGGETSDRGPVDEPGRSDRMMPDPSGSGAGNNPIRETNVREPSGRSSDKPSELANEPTIKPFGPNPLGIAVSGTGDSRSETNPNVGVDGPGLNNRPGTAIDPDLSEAFDALSVRSTDSKSVGDPGEMRANTNESVAERLRNPIGRPAPSATGIGTSPPRSPLITEDLTNSVTTTPSSTASSTNSPASVPTPASSASATAALFAPGTVRSPSIQVQPSMDDSAGPIQHTDSVTGHSVFLVSTLDAALRLASDRDIGKVELNATRLRLDRSVRIEMSELTIRSNVGGTVVEMTGTREAGWPNDLDHDVPFAAELKMLSLQDLHFVWDDSAAAESRGGGSLFELTRCEMALVTDCVFTVRRGGADRVADSEPGSEETRPAGAVFRFRSDRPNRRDFELVELSELRSANRPTKPWLDWNNVIVRGDGDLLHVDENQSIEFYWDNGLAAISGAMVRLGGPDLRDSPRGVGPSSLDPDDDIETDVVMDFSQLFVDADGGMVAAEMTERFASPSIRRSAKKSVFVIRRSRPSFAISGFRSPLPLSDWLELRGTLNAYDSDPTLSDPIARWSSTDGSVQTTAISQLLAESASGIAEAEPRMSVRWQSGDRPRKAHWKRTPNDYRIDDGSTDRGFEPKWLPSFKLTEPFEAAIHRPTVPIASVDAVFRLPDSTFTRIDFAEPIID